VSGEATSRIPTCALSNAPSSRQSASGDMRPMPLPAYVLWQEAERISRAHTPAIGVRTLDLLHVAAARVLKATRFCTFDTRQHALVRAAGLQIN
jgi:hypothetical protein